MIDALPADGHGFFGLPLLHVEPHQPVQQRHGLRVPAVAFFKLGQSLFGLFLACVKLAHFKISQGILGRAFFCRPVLALRAESVFSGQQQIAQIRPRGGIIRVQLHDFAQLRFGCRVVFLGDVHA